MKFFVNIYIMVQSFKVCKPISSFLDLDYLQIRVYTKRCSKKKIEFYVDFISAKSFSHPYIYCQKQKLFRKKPWAFPIYEEKKKTKKSFNIKKEKKKKKNFNIKKKGKQRQVRPFLTLLFLFYFILFFFHFFFST